jgi:Family of unknown function (DUF6210)
MALADSRSTIFWRCSLTRGPPREDGARHAEPEGPAQRAVGEPLPEQDDWCGKATRTANPGPGEAKELELYDLHLQISRDRPRPAALRLCQRHFDALNEKHGEATMSLKLILLRDLEQMVLIIACPDGVRYQNQVGGVVCWRAEMEGVLAPLYLAPEDADRIMTCPYPAGIMGITSEIADTIDTILGPKPATSFLKVDRTRLDESWEAWVHVLINVPPEAASGAWTSTSTSTFDKYTGPIYGFSPARGVLTWPNSD